MAAMRSNRYQEASRHYQDWLEVSPNNKNAMLGQAFFLDQRGEFEEGLLLSTRFIGQRPDDIQVILVHTNFLLMTGDFVNGERFFKKLPEQVAKLPASRGLLARIQANKEEFEPALTNAYAAYQAQPSSRNVLLNLFLLERLGQNTEGLLFLTKHIQQYPTDEASLMLLAERNLRTNRNAAIVSYETIIELNPDNFIVLNNLAFLYQEDGRLDEAEEYAERAVNINPDNADALDTLAQVKLAKNQLKPGLDILAKAVNQGDVSDEIYVNYIEALLINDQKVLASRRIEEREIKNMRAIDKLKLLKQKYAL